MNTFKDHFNKARDFNHYLKAGDESKLVMAPVIVDKKEEEQPKKVEAKKEEQPKKVEAKKEELPKPEAKSTPPSKEEPKKTA